MGWSAISGWCIAKSVLALMHDGDQEAARTPFALGLDYGARNRQDGWSTGQTISTVMMNLVPHLDADDRPRALYTGLTAIGRDCAGQPARFAIAPLPHVATDLPTLKRWFRQFIEVRDTEGAERCLASAIRAGHAPVAIADMLFAAATDHRYLDGGHVLDFTNKAFEALDWAGWDAAEVTLASLLPTFTSGQRMEETNEWRHPVNLVAILEDAFAKIPQALAQGQGQKLAYRHRLARTFTYTAGRRPTGHQRRPVTRPGTRGNVRGIGANRGLCRHPTGGAVPHQQ